MNFVMTVRTSTLTCASNPTYYFAAFYLLTNMYSASEIAAYVAQARKSGGEDAADMMAALQGAQTAYLQAAYDQAATSYGSMASYIDNGLQLDQATQNAIRQRLLV